MEEEHKSQLAKIIDAYNWIESRCLQHEWFSISVANGNTLISLGTTDGLKIREALAGSGCSVTVKADGSCNHCQTECDGQAVQWWEWRKPTPNNETVEIL